MPENSKLIINLDTPYEQGKSPFTPDLLISTTGRKVLQKGPNHHYFAEYCFRQGLAGEILFDPEKIQARQMFQGQEGQSVYTSAANRSGDWKREYFPETHKKIEAVHHPPSWKTVMARLREVRGRLLNGNALEFLIANQGNPMVAAFLQRYKDYNLVALGDFFCDPYERALQMPGGVTYTTMYSLNITHGLTFYAPLVYVHERKSEWTYGYTKVGYTWDSEDLILCYIDK